MERVQVVGRGLTMVENVTGRRGYGRAAGEGAISGALFALLGHSLTGGRRDFSSIRSMQA